MDLRPIGSLGHMEDFMYRNYCAKWFFSEISSFQIYAFFVHFSTKCDLWETSFCTPVPIHKTFHMTWWPYTSSIIIIHINHPTSTITSQLMGQPLIMSWRAKTGLYPLYVLKFQGLNKTPESFLQAKDDVCRPNNFWVMGQPPLNDS